MLNRIGRTCVSLTVEHFSFYAFYEKCGLQPVVGLRLGGPEARLKRGAPLMTLSYSANRDMHFDQA